MASPPLSDPLSVPFEPLVDSAPPAGQDHDQSDRLSRLSLHLSLLLQISASSISYISTRSHPHQISPDVPVWLPNAHATAHTVDGQEMRESLQELVADLSGRADEARRLILEMGEERSEEQVRDEMKELSHQMRQANVDFNQALEEAKHLQAELAEALGASCDGHAESRVKLAREIAGGDA